MAKRGLRKIGPGRFRVDFGRLRHSGLFGWLRGLLRPTPVEVDPYLVGWAVREVMLRCPIRSARGQRLVWNEYKVFLSHHDYQILLPLERRLLSGLARVIRETLDHLEADTVGDTVVRILPNEEDDSPAAKSEIVAAFVEDADLAPDRDGEKTVRVARRILPLKEDTQPMREPLVEGALKLRWEGGEALIPPQTKVRVGRPSAKPAERFVPLTGASRRISSFHMTLENAGDAVVIVRPVKANPVQVGGRLIQPGGKLRLSKLPVKISLSNGEMLLDLERLQG